ncbi:hypothetical protein [Dendrosporobacter sp. 1207_IL3150]|uniref:hypothetical protein n=1 Tax=Dendrosporobacter sp. 1207_IL3150 TaxID=3084054 RepID=UPI002FD9D977
MNILLILTLCVGLYLIYWSADIAAQLLIYDFGKYSMIPWWKDLLFNLGTGLVSSVILIFLYDQVIRFKAERERKVRESIAAKRVISAYEIFLFLAFYVLDPRAEGKNFAAFKIDYSNNCFNDDYYNAISQIDLTTKSVVDKDKSKLEEILEQIKQLSDSLSRTLGIYEPYLSSNIVNRINGIQTSKTLNGFVVMAKFSRSKPYSETPCYLEKDIMQDFKNIVGDIKVLIEDLRKLSA